MELLVTEYMNAYGENRNRNTVRVFLQRNYNYGYWIREDVLFNLLTAPQKNSYINNISSGYFDISFEVASEILKLGNTPYTKQKLYKEQE
mgnify:CR=1 FL=1